MNRFQGLLGAEHLKSSIHGDNIALACIEKIGEACQFLRTFHKAEGATLDLACTRFFLAILGCSDRINGCTPVSVL